MNLQDGSNCLQMGWRWRERSAGGGGGEGVALEAIRARPDPGWHQKGLLKKVPLGTETSGRLCEKVLTTKWDGGKGGPGEREML